MRTILINLPWSEGGRFGVRAGSRWPFTQAPQDNGYINYIPYPFFLAYAQALLLKESHDSVLIDAIAEGLSAVPCLERIRQLDPGLLLAETSTPSFASDIAFLENISRIIPGCRIALCGAHAGVFSRQILEQYSFISYVFKGEFEFSLLGLVRQLEKPNPCLGEVPGLIYREGKGIFGNKTEEIKDLDSLPWPERASLPMLKYYDGFCGMPRPQLQMLSGRGCPYGCIFCLWPQAFYSQGYRLRTPADVVAEMKAMTEKYNYSSVYFDDDVFNLVKEHALAIASQMSKAGIKLPWAAMARADLMDGRILESLAASGLYAVKYGVESADQSVVDACGKNMDLAKTMEAIKITKSLGVKVHLTFCVGLPGEKKENIDLITDFIMRSQPDSYQLSFATPFPGTKYYDYALQHDLLASTDWRDYDGSKQGIIRGTEHVPGGIEGLKHVIDNNIHI